MYHLHFHYDEIKKYFTDDLKSLLCVVFCIFVSCLLFVFFPCSLIGECVFLVV